MRKACIEASSRTHWHRVSQERKGHRKCCLWMMGTGMPLEPFLLGKKMMTYPKMSHERSPLVNTRTALVLPYQSPTLFEIFIPPL